MRWEALRSSSTLSFGAATSRCAFLPAAVAGAAGAAVASVAAVAASGSNLQVGRRLGTGSASLFLAGTFFDVAGAGEGLLLVPGFVALLLAALGRVALAISASEA